MRYSPFAFALSAALAGGLQAEETPASLGLTLDLPVADLAAFLDTQLPQVLYEEGPREIVCLETDLFDIDCDLTIRITREGPLTIGGEGGAVVLEQVIYAWARIWGDDFPVDHIRETGDARAKITVHVSPWIAPDWTEQADIESGLAWVDRPTVRLFDLFDVTFGSLAEPHVSDALARFRAMALEELARIDLRGPVEEGWLALQAPVPLGDGGPSLAFRPEGIGFFGLTLEGGHLRAAAHLWGRIEVGAAAGQGPVVPLPDLSPLADAPAGLTFNIPLRIDMVTLGQVLATQLPLVLTLDESVLGLVDEVQVLAVLPLVQDGRLGLVLDLQAGPLQGRVRLGGVPVYDPATGLLSIVDPLVGLEDAGALGVGLNLALAAGLAATGLDSAATFDLSGEVAGLTAALDELLNQTLAEGVTLTGQSRLTGAVVEILPDTILLRVQGIAETALELAP